MKQAHLSTINPYVTGALYRKSRYNVKATYSQWLKCKMESSCTCLTQILLYQAHTVSSQAPLSPPSFATRVQLVGNTHSLYCNVRRRIRPIGFPLKHEHTISKQEINASSEWWSLSSAQTPASFWCLSCQSPV